MNMRKNRLLFLLSALALAGGITWFSLHQTAQGPQIIEFDISRDGNEIIAIFDREWYWLLPGDRDSYSPETMLAYRAPHGDPLYAGRMKIKVLREKDQFIGFIAWYLKKPMEGFLNFVVVNPEFRGKRYAEKLVQYALDEMKKEGVQKISLVTRPSNQRARAVYNRMGFAQTGIDNDFVYFAYSF